jgi:hypothetical protein
VAEKSGGDIRPFSRFYLTNRAISGKSITLLVGAIEARIHLIAPKDK